MKAIKLTLLLVCCILSSCSYLKNIKLLTGGEIKRENYVQTIPFEWRKELIVVKVRLNSDTTEREFIFDTGAFNSKVESELATSLGLEVVTEKTNSTAQGISQKIEVVRIDSLQLGETTVYNIGAGKLTYAPTSASPCIAASGIIGANLIKLAHWKIDYEKQLLYFSDTPFEVHEGSYVLPFERPLLSGTPTINLEIEGRKVENILFDVGYNGGLTLPLSVANHFDSSQSNIILDQSTSGIYGTNTDSLLVKNLEANVGGAKAQIPVEFSALNKALLGNEFLKHFTIVINYEKKEIYLQKQQEVQIAPPSSFSVAIHNDSLWVVSRTTPELTLQLGETLLAVNGKKPNDLFTSYCDYVMNIGKLFEQDSLKVQKMNGTVLNISIK
jgi:predicted aspartyl protease